MCTVLNALGEVVQRFLRGCIQRVMTQRAGISRDCFISLPSSFKHPSLPVVGFFNELRAIGITQYQQLVWKPYRVVYEIVGDTVFVMVIADGRRDMQTLLQQRLLT